MISDAITLPMVEGLIASRKPFPPAIKEQFERDSRERHARRLKIQMLAAAIVITPCCRPISSSFRTYGKSRPAFTG